VSTPANVTQILDEIASERLPAHEGFALLYPAVYQEIRRLARGIMRSQAPGHTLTPTALVHEAYLRLVAQPEIRSRSRAQFFAAAAKAMRSILVDHARRKGARKRGGSWHRVTMIEEATPAATAAGSSSEYEVLDLHAALDALEGKDARLATVVELRVFGGLTVDEASQVLNVSARTIDSDWKVAKAWLADRLTPRDAP
jgi:RNA polymerase sigma factor (TIGR02999 family)